MGNRRLDRRYATAFAQGKEKFARSPQSENDSAVPPSDGRCLVTNGLQGLNRERLTTGSCSPRTEDIN